MEFFTGENWIRTLILFIVTIGIFVFAALNFFYKRKKSDELREKDKSKTTKVKDSKRVKISQADHGSDAKVTGSEDVDIQQ